MVPKQKNFFNEKIKTPLAVSNENYGMLIENRNEEQQESRFMISKGGNR